MIPARLKSKDFRFVLIKPHEKIAMEKSWNKNKNYEYTDAKLVNWLQQGGNYGVLLGNKVFHDNSKSEHSLIVIDADTKEIQAIVEAILPETLTITTGKGKHYYFWINGEVKTQQLTSGSKNLGHIKAMNSYVLAPGSIHPSGSRYKVEKDIEIGTITMEMLQAAFRNYTITESFNKIQRVNLDASKYPIVDIVDVSKMHRIGKYEYQGSSVVHGSTTGHNFLVNTQKNLWFCFRHGVGGTTLQLLALMLEYDSVENFIKYGISRDVYDKVKEIWMETHES